MILDRTSYLARLLLMGVAFAVACDRPPQNDAKASTPAAVPVRTLPSDRPTADWWYGESVDAYGPRAWFVQFGADSAKIYEPPGLTRLCRDRGEPADSIRWRANLEPSGRVSEIDGPVTGEGGARLTVRTVRPGRAAADTTRITLHPLLSHERRTAPDGVYSTLSTHAETGDLLGKELLLAETSTGLVGALVMGEGAASGPYPMREITLVHDTIRFTTITEGGPIEYIARIGARDATLWVAGDSERERLPRRGGTIEFLRRERVRACGALGP